MNEAFETQIRPECLTHGAIWSEPTGPEIREVIRRLGFTGSQVASFLGMSAKSSGRHVRKWIAGDASIPYSAWAILCEGAGLGKIWVLPDEEA